MKKYIILFICLFFFTIYYFLGNVSHLLVKQSSNFPSKPDAIVVLGGGDGNRIKKAADFYTQSNANYMIMTAGPIFDSSYAKLMKDYAIKLGIPESNIILEQQSLSTKDHPNYLIPIFKNYDIKNIVIVTVCFIQKDLI